MRNKIDSYIKARRSEMIEDILEPVSYTHLDVYKRQLCHPGRLWICPAF